MRERREQFLAWQKSQFDKVDYVVRECLCSNVYFAVRLCPQTFDSKWFMLIRYAAAAMIRRGGCKVALRSGLFGRAERVFWHARLARLAWRNGLC